MQAANLVPNAIIHARNDTRDTDGLYAGDLAQLQRVFWSFVLIVAAMGLVTSVAQLLALRVLQGVIAGFSVFAMALASVSCPKDKVPVAIGRVQGAQLLSVAIGPAAGGYVASHFGLRYAFFVTAGMCALALVGLIALFTETRQPAPAGPVVAAAEAGFTLRQVWTSRGFPLVLALLFVAALLLTGLPGAHKLDLNDDGIVVPPPAEVAP